MNRFLLASLFFITTLAATDVPEKAVPSQAGDNQNLSFEIYNPVRTHSKIKCLMVVIGNNELLTPIANQVQFDLEFSDQLEIEVKRHATEIDPGIMAKLFAKGTSLCLFLKEQQPSNSKHITLVATLKDASSNQSLFTKTFTCKTGTLIYNTHAIADQLMPVLTGESGPMLSTLSYCKQLGPMHKVVCLADFACKYERTVVPNRTINVAPCWHSQAPVLFYSQFTRSNSRLMSYDLRSRNHKVICSYDGLNMQPSFSPDGKKAVLCLSEGGNTELYMYDTAQCKKAKQRVFNQITHNKGNNSSPCLLPDGNVVFCSDFQTNRPQIYKLTMQTNHVRRLTNGLGYCAAPAYCAKNNSIAYTRYVNRVFQIFTLSLDDGKMRERQLTFTAGDKVEPTWSECGRYIAFTFAHREVKTSKVINQIAVLNTMSGQIKILTTSKEQKSFPSWTGRTLYQL